MLFDSTENSTLVTVNIKNLKKSLRLGQMTPLIEFALDVLFDDLEAGVPWRGMSPPFLKLWEILGG